MSLEVWWRNHCALLQGTVQKYNTRINKNYEKSHWRYWVPWPRL